MDIISKTLKKGGDVIFSAEIDRDKNGKLEFYVNVSEEIEDLFRNNNNGTKISEVWQNSNDNHEFYLKPDKSDLNSQLYSKLYLDVFNAYGSKMFDSNANINMAILRTKGIGKGVKFQTNDHFTEEILTAGLKQLRNFIKEVYIEFIRPVKLKASLTTIEM